jgi:hypothetical protein
MHDIAEHLRPFLEAVAAGAVDVYNEFSLQHELGIHLRSRHPNWLVQFERNVSYFGGSAKTFKKREIDLTIFTQNPKTLHYAVELKYPRNGQVPEQMFNFCKDIQFAEELVSHGFQSAALLTLAEDPLFYRGPGEGIYAYFRGAKPLTGRVVKPTGAKDDEVNILGSYTIKWIPLRDELQYFLVVVQR